MHQSRLARPRSYEEILAEHAFPPRSRGRGPRHQGARMASFTTFFMTEVSCLAGNFSERELLSCCARPVRRGCPFHRPGRSWSFCCEKELLKQVLEAVPQRYSRNLTGVPAWKLPEGRPPDCKVIPRLPSMTLQMWLARLLQHGAEAARCVHGLAHKLQETPEAAESVAFLAAELARKCPGRRTLLALRRNLMIWWDRNKFLTRWAEMEATFQQALLSVYNCQQKLPAVPVIHLHIPKTAGSSMKQWASLTGFLD